VFFNFRFEPGPGDIAFALVNQITLPVFRQKLFYRCNIGFNFIYVGVTLIDIALRDIMD